MFQGHDSAAMLAHKLQQIKLLHTAVWAFGLTLLIIGECVVLAINGGRCPLTDVAAGYTNDRAISISTCRCGWHATTSRFLVSCSWLVNSLLCRDGSGGPDFDFFRAFAGNSHRF
jgi:hypothetical protein